MADEPSFLDEIEARVRPTICQTFSGRGATVEGRISEDDFDFLLTTARTAIETLRRIDRFVEVLKPHKPQKEMFAIQGEARAVLAAHDGRPVVVEHGDG